MNDQPGVTELPDQLRDEQALRISELERALEEADGCFEAALVEGWLDALANGDIDRIRDIWSRRLCFARSALSPGGK